LLDVEAGLPMWEWSLSRSEASYEHKAFQYWAPKKLLAGRCG
jgi:hypothetical protein